MTNPWDQYWQSDAKSGEVFVTKDGQKSEELTAFWREKLGAASSGDSILDIAAGGGSIFASLLNASEYKLHATDISHSALQSLRQKFSGASTLQCDAAKMPINDSCFDWVVSQFGIEYSDIAAFVEAARVLKPGGQLIFISHIKGSLIDERNNKELNGIKVCEQTGFIALAKLVVDALTKPNAPKSADVFAKFQKIEPEVAQFANETPNLFIGHLYFGFRQLVENFSRYEPRAINDWLIQMQQQMKDILNRLDSMLAAAKDEKQMSEILAVLRESGIEMQPPKVFYSTKNNAKVAWILEGEKRFQ